MSITDAAFLIGPVAGPVLAVASCVVVLATGPRARTAAPVSVLAFAVLASFVAYWWHWGTAYEHAEALREVPAGVQSTLDLTTNVCAGAALAATAFAGIVLARTALRPAGSGRPRP